MKCVDSVPAWHPKRYCRCQWMPVLQLPHITPMSHPDGTCLTPDRCSPVQCDGNVCLKPVSHDNAASPHPRIILHCSRNVHPTTSLLGYIPPPPRPRGMKHGVLIVSAISVRPVPLLLELRNYLSSPEPAILISCLFKHMMSEASVDCIIFAQYTMRKGSNVQRRDATGLSARICARGAPRPRSGERERMRPCAWPRRARAALPSATLQAGFFRSLIVFQAIILCSRSILTV